MSLRTLIVEDERPSRERLIRLLKGLDDLEIVGEAADGDAAVAMIDDLRPDLVFLDIHMPGANGFEVLARAKHRPLVIFVTAYDEYAVRAFDANAVDYVLKPSSRERVVAAVTRARERRREPDRDLLERLRTVMERGTHMKRFAVNLADEILVIIESEIHCFRAEDKGVRLCTRDREFDFNMTLKELEQSLDPEVFCRVHKSCIVSLDKVRRLQRWFHGDLIVQLQDARKSQIKVGRAYRDELRRRLHL